MTLNCVGFDWDRYDQSCFKYNDWIRIAGIGFSDWHEIQRIVGFVGVGFAVIDLCRKSDAFGQKMANLFRDSPKHWFAHNELFRLNLNSAVALPFLGLHALYYCSYSQFFHPPIGWKSYSHLFWWMATLFLGVSVRQSLTAVCCQGALKTAGTPALSKKCRAFSSLGAEIQHAFGPFCPLTRTRPPFVFPLSAAKVWLLTTLRL